LADLWPVRQAIRVTVARAAAGLASRVALEREVLAALLAVDHPTRLRRLQGLQLVGIGRGHFSGVNAHLFAAIVTLACQGEDVGDVALACASRGRVTADHVTWLRTAYGTQRSLYALAVALLAAERRSLLASVGAVATNAARDPAADVDRTLAILVGHLRRARSVA
jgi:hypothetical protein